MTRKHWLLATACFVLGLASTPAQTPATNSPPARNPDALRDVVIFIIRHAEKPETGSELTLAGFARANAYTNYFKNFTLDSKPLHLDHVFAATDSKASQRPRLTAEPLSKALGLTLDTRFTDKKPELLAGELQSKPHGRQILVCWRHGEIPPLLTALGADPAKLLPGGKWPDDVYCWMLQLRFDSNGHLAQAQCINENLMPGDDAKHPLANQ